MRRLLFGLVFVLLFPLVFGLISSNTIKGDHVKGTVSGNYLFIGFYGKQHECSVAINDPIRSSMSMLSLGDIADCDKSYDWSAYVDVQSPKNFNKRGYSQYFEVPYHYNYWLLSSNSNYDLSWTSTVWDLVGQNLGGVGMGLSGDSVSGINKYYCGTSGVCGTYGLKLKNPRDVFFLANAKSNPKGFCSNSVKSVLGLSGASLTDYFVRQASVGSSFFDKSVCSSFVLGRDGLKGFYNNGDYLNGDPKDYVVYDGSHSFVYPPMVFGDEFNGQKSSGFYLTCTNSGGDLNSNYVGIGNGGLGYSFVTPSGSGLSMNLDGSSMGLVRVSKASISCSISGSGSKAKASVFICRNPLYRHNSPLDTTWYWSDVLEKTGVKCAPGMDCITPRFDSNSRCLEFSVLLINISNNTMNDSKSVVPIFSFNLTSSQDASNSSGEGTSGVGISGSSSDGSSCLGGNCFVADGSDDGGVLKKLGDIAKAEVSGDLRQSLVDILLEISRFFFNVVLLGFTLLLFVLFFICFFILPILFFRNDIKNFRRLMDFKGKGGKV